MGQGWVEREKGFSISRLRRWPIGQAKATGTLSHSSSSSSSS
ncbi:hypothetical protein T4B_6028 [Trichinella pseudospiralis]|nr:hypothetical protein T4B_6028 [Trichinella pseudospiralis]